MSYRYMRILIMFDLPIKTSKDKREYRKFRKYLITSGFVMLQKSIYTKISLTQTSANTTIKNVNLNKPPKGVVQILTITEKQYGKMELIVGEIDETHVNTDEKLVIL